MVTTITSSPADGFRFPEPVAGSGRPAPVAGSRRPVAPVAGAYRPGALSGRFGPAGRRGIACAPAAGGRQSQPHADRNRGA
jgi:hypothetical protein